MKRIQDTMGRASDATNAGQSILNQVDAVNSCLRPIKRFSSIVEAISDVRLLSFGTHVTKLRLGSPICETSFICTIMGR